jgi:hypothetical protein
MAPFNTDEMLGAKTKNIRLYVKRVFISDEFDGELVSFTTSCDFGLFCLCNSYEIIFLMVQLGSELTSDICLCSSHGTWVSLKVWWTPMTFL